MRSGPAGGVIAMKAKINRSLLRNLPAPPCDIYDTELPGFVLRLRPSGEHSYLQRIGGRWFTVGRVRVVSGEQPHRE